MVTNYTRGGGGGGSFSREWGDEAMGNEHDPIVLWEVNEDGVDMHY